MSVVFGQIVLGPPGSGMIFIIYENANNKLNSFVYKLISELDYLFK